MPIHHMDAVADNTPRAVRATERSAAVSALGCDPKEELRAEVSRKAF